MKCLCISSEDKVTVVGTKSFSLSPCKLDEQPVCFLSAVLSLAAVGGQCIMH